MHHWQHQEKQSIMQPTSVDGRELPKQEEINDKKLVDKVKATKKHKRTSFSKSISRKNELEEKNSAPMNPMRNSAQRTQRDCLKKS